VPIKKDHSDIPFASRATGKPPVERPIIVSLVAETWHRKYVEEGNDQLAMSIEGRLFRASWAAKRCDRALQYAMQKVGASNPPSLADHWRFGIGSMVHEVVQQILPAAFPHADIEAAVDLRPIGIDGAASADVVLRDMDGNALRVIELKTINGFGFKKSATAFKGPAEGPRWSAVVQGALSAAALNAVDGLVIGYLSLENLSPNMAVHASGEVGRFAAEWHYTLDECKEIAAAEAARVNNVINYIASDGLTARTLHEPELPSGASVVNPERGMWNIVIDGQVVGAGSTWLCDYCDHRDTCVADGPGGVLNGGETDVF
jgi:hypothetical protein